jgi:hypothetical protein
MKPFNPLDYPICFSFPHRLVRSAWIGHIPFGMFILGLVKPRIFVELGTHTGVSYCAFCQAAVELGVQVRCIAIDTWEGDEQAGLYGPEVLDELRRSHDELYGNFSQLLKATFNDALEQFPDGTIDLLHIDGLHSYHAVKHDFETWLPKMSERGVVLLHDIDVRKDDFGVWKLWDELRVNYPHFAMPHSSGLGVLAVGKEPPPKLLQLLEAPSCELDSVRCFFQEMGARLEFAERLSHMTELYEQRNEVVRTLEHDLNVLRQSRTYRIGSTIMAPMRGCRNLLSRLAKK